MYSVALLCVPTKKIDDISSIANFAAPTLTLSLQMLCTRTHWAYRQSAFRKLQYWFKKGVWNCGWILQTGDVSYSRMGSRKCR